MILYYIEAVSIASVDIYVLITGYFLSHQRARAVFRPLELLFQVCFFKIMEYMVQIFNGQPFSMNRLIGSLIPNNYFVVLYCALYISSLLANKCIEELSEISLRRATLIVLLLFSAWPILADILNELTQKEYQGLSTIGLYGSQSGYTIVTFFCLYIIGAYIRNQTYSLPPKRICFCAFLGLSVVEFIWMVAERKLLPGYYTATYYHNPVIIGLATSILCLFLQIRFESDLVNRMAKAGFVCFLIHQPFLKLCRIETIVHEDALVMIANMLISVVCIYLVTFLIYELYTHSIGRLLRKLESYFPIIEL